jgi:hypothetical protein
MSRWSDNECLAIPHTAMAVTRVITTLFTQRKKCGQTDVTAEA